MTVRRHKRPWWKDQCTGDDVANGILLALFVWWAYYLITTGHVW